MVLSKSMLFVTTLLVTSLSLLPSSSSAHMAISYPRAQGGPWTDNHENGVHAWIGYKGKKFPCGNYQKGPVTKLKAGQIVDVEFWNYDRGDWTKFPPKLNTPQGRHGGGSCEFSLSPDGGKNWHVIGQYTKTCPDLTYKWPVQIPKNIPECKDSDKCLFSWSWVAFKTNQFYHHCANVEIEADSSVAVKDRQLPPLRMTVVDVKQLGQRQETSSLGDGKNSRSTGPSKEEIDRNTNGFYAYGGGAGTKGIDLLLRRNGRLINKRRLVEDDEVEAAEANSDHNTRVLEPALSMRRPYEY